MSNKQLYKFGLYGRCPSCKEIQVCKCVFCGEADYFTDSSKSGYVLCNNCNTHNKFNCKNETCNNQPLVLRTPKNENEKGRIEEFVKRKKDKTKDRRIYDLKVDHVKKTIITEVEIDENGSIANLDSKKKDFKIDFSKAKEIALALEKEKQVKKESEELEKPKDERRIVNQFYDQDDDEYIDKKINFPLEFKDTVFFNCHLCAKDDVKVTCNACGKSDEFSLDYDVLTCSCGNEMKMAQCSCGARHGIGKFYLKSGEIEWRYDKSKSYYRYRKGRMLAFSTCPSCGIFMVEKCTECGSKVNFGKPNSKNEVYCKNCGTINQFKCQNKACNSVVKIIKNPTSVEEKYEWLNKAMDIGEQKEFNKAAGSKVSFTNSFIEEVEKKTKENITTSFIGEVEEQIQEKKNLENELHKHNIKQIEYIFQPKSSSSGGSLKWIFIIVIILGVGGYFGWKYYFEPNMANKENDVNTNIPIEDEQVGMLEDSVSVVVDSISADIPDSLKIDDKPDSSKIIHENE
ncbi:MAG: hypothetical protein JXR48_18560 [Candidatus Delongbacteria bacterium]|nr:hypothetical protein [Candidatus Delongbacteria bacterium]MBN2836964.1 hypothetical protein [Candidatus Delongbacteria bacterium]